MEKNTKVIIDKLGTKLVSLPQPIHLLAICTGGITVAKMLAAYLRRKKIKASYYEVWTNLIKGKSYIWKTNFNKEDYIGSAVIVDDVIWHRTHLPSIKKYLKKLNSRKRIYIASLLDCNHKSDFAVFR